MKKTVIEISRNDLRKSLPDVACNEAEGTFFAVWAAAPGMESSSADYFISGQKISSSGEAVGAPVEVLKTDDILMLPRVLHNPNKNQYLVIYCRGENNFNIRGIILDAAGRAVGGQFKVTDVPANQFHYTMAFNSRRNQFLITYNDFRDDISTAYGVIIDDTGAVVKEEFAISNAPGHQVNPVVCYNPQNDTYLVNWEDFRAHGNSLEALGTLEVMTDIYGALLSADGAILVNDIPMCADAGAANADQRFNGIAYNPKKNEFLASWTDTRTSLHNVGIMGRIVKADGSMPEADFPLVNLPGAQMIGHIHYAPQQDAYFIAFECDSNDVDKFYFKDIKAHLAIAALWLDGSGRPASGMIDMFSGSGNQRFVRFAHSAASNTFLLVWQSDFPGVSDSVEGHIMSAGGNIMGALYKK
ncbi:MAG: hypothetical protein JW832_16880 [Deltaproteobacteria bacterium]|nr:hypothetical protein [Deltaproteobacteria bacterium]